MPGDESGTVGRGEPEVDVSGTHPCCGDEDAHCSGETPSLSCGSEGHSNAGDAASLPEQANIEDGSIARPADGTVGGMRSRGSSVTIPWQHRDRSTETELVSRSARETTPASDGAGTVRDHPRGGIPSPREWGGPCGHRMSWRHQRGRATWWAVPGRTPHGEATPHAARGAGDRRDGGRQQARPARSAGRNRVRRRWSAPC